MTDMNPESQFDQWAPEYDEAVRDEASFPFAGYSHVLSRVVALAAPEPGMALLELGPGTGNLTVRLVQTGAAVWAVDFSVEMIARASRKAPQASFAKAGLMDDYPPEFHRPFDRVISTYTFHELPFPNKLTLLRRLFAHHLVPDGFVVIGDIGFPNTIARDAVRAQAGEEWDEEFYWIQDETADALAIAGFAMEWEQISRCGAVIVIRTARES